MSYKKGEFLSYITKTLKSIYCASALFSPLDRIGAANLAHKVEYEIKEYLQLPEQIISKLIFLPFRDTDQTKIIGHDRARRIYEMDLEQLKTSGAFLARVDGLTKDSGVAMELGYAYALDIPIGILLTDFIWEGYRDVSGEWTFDPIIEYMSDVSMVDHQLVLTNQSYYSANLILEEKAVRDFVRQCIVSFERPNVATKVFSTPSDTSIYIDFMGGRYEWAREYQERLYDQLTNYADHIFVAKRYYPDKTKSVNALRESVQEDIAHAIQSKIAIFSGDSFQMDSGSAALFGLCAALEKTIIFQYSSPICYRGAGQQKMCINLMIEQAATIRTSTINETYDIVVMFANQRRRPT